MRYPKISQLKIPETYSLEETGCTQSLARCFRQCPRKFLFKINRWQSKKDQEKYAIGNINHDCLSCIYKEGIYNVDKSIKNESEKYCYIEKSKLEFYKTISQCILEKYIQYYKDDFKTAKFTNTEREFAVDINGIRWRGKIDGEYTVKKDKSLWVLETKNKSRINDETIMKGLCFDFQGRLYCKANEVESGKKTAGFIYNVIRIPQMRLRQNDTLEMFSQRLRDDIDKRPEYYFMRWDVPLTEQDKKEFDQDVDLLTTELDRFIDFNGCWKIKNTFSCSDLISPCEYLDACIQGHMGGYYQSEKIFNELGCGL